MRYNTLEGSIGCTDSESTITFSADPFKAEFFAAGVSLVVLDCGGMMICSRSAIGTALVL